MQEEQGVTFQPIYEGYQPWYARLFALYLLLVLVIMVMRFVNLVRSFRKLRKLQQGRETGSPEFNSLWSRCHSKAISFKELATLTFFLSMLDLSCWLAEILSELRTAKIQTPDWGYILPAIADALTTFSLGTLICVALYCCALIAEAALRRRSCVAANPQVTSPC